MRDIAKLRKCKTASDLLRWVEENDVIFEVPTALVRACDDAGCGLLLSQLLDLLDSRKDKDEVSPRAGVMIDGHRYVAGTAAEWAHRLGTKPQQMSTIINKLRKKGFIKTVVRKFGKRRMLHITVVKPVVDAASAIAALELDKQRLELDKQRGDK